MKFVFINTGTKTQNSGIIRCVGFGSALSRMGHKVTILISDQSENLNVYGKRYKGVDFIYTASGHIKEETDKLIALLRLQDVDVVHCMGAGTKIFLPALIAKKIFMKKFRLVVDYEDKQSLLTPKKLRRFMLLLEKLSFVYADIMLCASSFLADEYCKKSRCEAFYLPYGLNYREVKGSQISYYADDFKEIKVAYLGNLVFPYKEQFDFLIEAFPHVKQFINKCSLHIIGEGPMRSYINERIRDLGLKESVTFHGYVHDERLLSLLGSMDVLVLPFADVPVNRYRCPNKVFIYAQTGLPIVTNQVGEVFSVMKNYPRAYFYLENNVKSFCDTLKKAITTKGTYDLTQFYLSQSWEMITKNYLKIINRQLLS